jgi:hypothetical protein
MFISHVSFSVFSHPENQVTDSAMASPRIPLFVLQMIDEEVRIRSKNLHVPNPSPEIVEHWSFRERARLTQLARDAMSDAQSGSLTQNGYEKKHGLIGDLVLKSKELSPKWKTDPPALVRVIEDTYMRTDVQEFHSFDTQIQQLAWFAGVFSHSLARELWPEPESNSGDLRAPENRFWTEFENCSRNPVAFYNGLDRKNRKVVFRYIKIHGHDGDAVDFQ